MTIRANRGRSDAITFGLVVMATIYATGHISGAHVNPAVTLAFAVTCHLPWPLASGYWAAQLAGGIAASLFLRALFGDVAHLGATLPRGSDGQSFALAIALTFFLMFVISGATDVRAVGQAATIAIGDTVGHASSSSGRHPWVIGVADPTVAAWCKRFHRQAPVTSPCSDRSFGARKRGVGSGETRAPVCGPTL